MGKIRLETFPPFHPDIGRRPKYSPKNNDNIGAKTKLGTQIPTRDTPITV